MSNYKEDKPWTELKDIISKYVQQLTLGCGNGTCTERLCHTGLQNSTPQKPIRRFTPRSARSIAIVVVGGPFPDRHLCPHLSNRQTQDDGSDSKIPSEGPRDSSAFSQQLHDTSAIKTLSSMTSYRPFKEGEQLKQLHRSLHPLTVGSPMEILKSDDAIMSNIDAAEIVCKSFRWVSAHMRVTEYEHILYIDTLIKNNLAYPTDWYAMTFGDAKDDWLLSLDKLHHESSVRLVQHILQAVATRASFESAVEELRKHVASADVAPRQHAGKDIISLILQKLSKDEMTMLTIILCLKTAFLMHWDGQAVLPQRSTTSAALKLLAAWGKSLGDDMVSMPAVGARMDAIEIAMTWMSTPSKQIGSHLLSYQFLFGPKERAVYFRGINHLRMRKAHSLAEKTGELRRYASSDRMHIPEIDYEEQHYLLLDLSRENVLRDAYDQLWHRRKGDLLRPLRVRLGEMNELEVGHDLGGVQVEFFNLLCKEAFVEAAQMFTTDETTGLCYFKPCSLQPLYMFELLGTLFALAVYNGITLPVNMPETFYLMLMVREPTLARFSWHDTIARDWPTVAQSLHAILTQDIEDLEYSFPLEANGLRMDVTTQQEDISESVRTLGVVSVTAAAVKGAGLTGVDVGNLDWPGWRFTNLVQPPPSVSAQNKHRYAADYHHWMALGSVQPQLRAFCNAFHAIIDAHSLEFFTPASLKSLVEGSARINVTELRRATRYEGYEPSTKYIQSFWRIVESWSEEKQMQLLKFVTAVERVPLGGAENIRFVIQRAEPESIDHLPTSSTCFGTLRLPRYRSSEVMEEKLSLAIKYGLEGFGTG